MGLFDEPFKQEQPIHPKKPEEKLSKEILGFGLQLTCEDRKRAITSGTTTSYELRLKNLSKREDTILLKISLMYAMKEGDEGPEWNIKLVADNVEETFQALALEKEVHIESEISKKFVLNVTAPRGVRYGDRVDVVITATSKGDPAISDSITVTTTARQSILAVKTSIGHEKTVADSLASKARVKDVGVFSILSPTTLRGYLLVEAMNVDGLRNILKGVYRARGLVEGETSFTEIDHFLTPKPLVSGIVEGDIVELVAGPFKGEKARVQRIDESKEEITVELFEAMVPIPITVRGDHVRVIEKEK